MPFSIEDLRAFLTIAQTKSFTLAADKLLVTSPAITRRIKKMEELIGEPLFDRTTHMVRITPAGQSLYPRAEHLLREFDNFQAAALSLSNDRAMTVSFACVTSVAGSLLPGIISSFRDRFPACRYDLHDGHGKIVHRLVEEQVVEFGIGTRPDPDSNLEFAKLIDAPIVAAIPKNHELFDVSGLSWAEVAHREFMMLKGESSFFGHVETELRRADIAMPNGIRVHDASTLLGFVEQGASPIIMTGLFASRSAPSEVRAITISRPELYSSVGLLTSPERQLSAAARDLIAFTKDELPRRHRRTLDQLSI